MTEEPKIRIGNQTSFSAVPLTAPFEYAVENGFDAFEWFPDKKKSGGWEAADISEEMREDIRRAAVASGMRLSVHAPWPSNPLKQESAAQFASAIGLARDIGAGLFNIHFHMEEGVEAFVGAVTPLLQELDGTGIVLSIENTPETAPEDFNDLFASLRKFGYDDPSRVGICLDLGHANLCRRTRNNYLGFIDLLGPHVPVVHVHLHENYGDSDSHLPVFTGPSAQNESGIRGFLERLRERNFSGSIILEQWPDPPALLSEARKRLREMFAPAAGDVFGRQRGPGDDFCVMIAKADRQFRSWRKKLDWISGLFDDKTFVFTDEKLAYLAVYLRFVGTGQVPMAEDGGHYRPSHHARISLHIYERLSKIENAGNSFIIRKIYPWLPSFDTPFMRAEPLTRIRDIAHRNDIPGELKEEIKHTLQNKLHRSAGPEDLVTSSRILHRITAPDASYSPAFVEEFRRFHEELKEFFNARSLKEQLTAISKKRDADIIRRFLALKEGPSSTETMLGAFSLITDIRTRFAGEIEKDSGAGGQELRNADILLEDYSFAVLSSLVNNLTARNDGTDWGAILRGLVLVTSNLSLSGFDKEECRAIEHETGVWSLDFDAGDMVKLLRLKSTMDRALRLSEDYATRILNLFPEKAERLGRALGVAEHAVKVFSEADIRSHTVFHLSKLLSFSLQKIRELADLPPWDVIIPGKSAGRLAAADTLAGLNAPEGPVIALLRKVEGDEEVPENVKGIIVSEETPHLSHLAVRARQRKVLFAVCEDRKFLAELEGLSGKNILVDMSDGKVDFREYAGGEDLLPKESYRQVVIPHIISKVDLPLMPLRKATVETAGNKAFAAGRLEELRHANHDVFLTPPGMVVPFGVLDRALDGQPALKKEYSTLRENLNSLADEEFDGALERLREVILSLPVPDEIISGVNEHFKRGTRLMVRSSSNLEDLKGMSGAGLYESFANVHPPEVGPAIKNVWASLWTRRAALSRKMAGVSHEKAHMAVLIQQMIVPDYSFILHTANPVNRDLDEIYMELAVGLGETLASAKVAGLPYRISWNKRSEKTRVLAFANFSRALLPRHEKGAKWKTVDYSQSHLSRDSGFRDRLSARLGKIGTIIEAAFGTSQDIEGVVAGSDIYIVQSRPQQGEAPEKRAESSCRVMALFQKRIEGDDALLELARLRFSQAGLGAEYYAESPAELERLLRFGPGGEAAAVVHLGRQTDLFNDSDRRLVGDFAGRFGKKIYGMVVHDQIDMSDRVDDYIQALRTLERPLSESGCHLFIEYAAGLAPETFILLFERIRDLAHVSCGIDTGHIGLHYVRTVYAKLHQGRDIFAISPTDADMPLLVEDIQSAVGSALEGVLSVIGKIGAMGKPMHLHLHDGHPLSRSRLFGVSDHLSFLEKIPLHFEYRGKRFLEPMFGASGLAKIVAEALAIGREGVSFTIEVHPPEGRLPLGDAANLFGHWKDKTNAERMNYWLSVIAANSRMVIDSCHNR